MKLVERQKGEYKYELLKAPDFCSKWMYLANLMFDIQGNQAAMLLIFIKKELKKINLFLINLDWF